MPGERHPTDPIVDDLTRVYVQAVARLELIVAAGLRRGLDPARLGSADQQTGDSTLAYRARQLEQARELVAEIQRQGATIAPLVVGRAYGAGLVAVDRTVANGAKLSGQFGRVHTRAVAALAVGMRNSLAAATRTMGMNVETVFERADALSGALPASGRVAGIPFIGRRIDDPYRRVALEAVAEGAVTLDTRRQVSTHLARRLVTEGVTDATTGFVDRAGRRWPLPNYVGMVARTTTREAVSAATANRLDEHGVDLVTITSHPHAADECTPYDGHTFSLSGSDTTYPRLERRPPFHPNAVLGDDQLLAPVGRVVSGVRAVYDGPAIEIESAAGVRARVSPHHPVLTCRGWMPARLVREGDEVLRDPIIGRHPAAVAGQDLHDMPALAQQVFDAAGAAGSRGRAVAAATDLHGDARFCEREVDVVRPDRQLRGHVLPAAAEQDGEALLVSARAGSPYGARPGARLERLGGVRRPVARPLPDGYPHRPEPTKERGRREWATEREDLRALARAVATDEVVKVRYLDRWRGHAYDFQTEGGVYFAGGLYSHNCRHVITPAEDDFDRFERELLAAATAAGT